LSKRRSTPTARHIPALASSTSRAQSRSPMLHALLTSIMPRPSGAVGGRGTDRSRMGSHSESLGANIILHEQRPQGVVDRIGAVAEALGVALHVGDIVLVGRTFAH